LSASSQAFNLLVSVHSHVILELYMIGLCLDSVWLVTWNINLVCG